MDFTALYQEFFKPVFSYVLCRVGDRALAEDLCAAAWRKAYEKQHQFQPEKGTFRQWIFTIARNEINMHHRLYYVRKFLSLTGWEEAVSVSPVYEQHSEEEARLLHAVSRLNEREKELVALKFYSGLNNRQIAAQTGMTESNVGTVLSRAISKLRKEIKDE
uniref:Specialized sigma subunit of RNA polymerase n=1 Tax=uncultured Elusimicrobia bacterium TaxID=699876 RepID=A0A650EMZ2_9BACT|nr:specialized sigma subunit of RNA polymerase [uncultured Elusimicrobia bacterium]